MYLPGGLPALRSAAAACPHALLCGDAPNLVPPALGEPDVARVGGPGRDTQRLAAKFVPTGRWQGERGDAATSGDAPDRVPKGQGEPQVAIRPGRDADRVAAARGGGELGDGANGGSGGSSAQAQQADRDNYGGDKGGHARPQTRDIHGSCSFV